MTWSFDNLTMCFSVNEVILCGLASLGTMTKTLRKRPVISEIGLYTSAYHNFAIKSIVQPKKVTKKMSFVNLRTSVLEVIA